MANSSVQSVANPDKEVRLRIENLDLRRLLIQAGIDAAEHQATERLQRLVLEELHHRVKNTLATVMAIVTQTLRAAETIEHCSEAITHRLLALGRVHDLLLQTKGASASFAEIVRTAIEPFDRTESGRFVVDSAAIDVSPPAVLPLAMVLNELCTNALKYGALSGPTGRVEIRTLVDTQQGQFRLTWAESGGPPVGVPNRRSFGSRLIEHGLVGQLSGRAKLAFDPSGVVCVLDIPLTSLRV